MSLAVFGGTFDPPHNAHLAIAQAALDRGLAERVLFVPAAEPPHKHGVKVSPFRHRLRMLEIALEGNSSFEISSIEAERLPAPSYTIDTLDELSRRRPGERLLLLIGSDSLVQLHTWMRGRELAERYGLLCYPREGHLPSMDELRANWPPQLASKLAASVMDGLPSMKISSTEIRLALANSENADRFISCGVLDYIRAEGLYQACPN